MRLNGKRNGYTYKQQKQHAVAVFKYKVKYLLHNVRIIKSQIPNSKN
jgi:hypothetical protein